jgi:hypothetical protein
LVAIGYSWEMVKLLFLGALILLVSGCQREPGGANVSFMETRVDETHTGDCRIEMREGHPTAIPARGDGVACGFVEWERPHGTSAAVAAVSAQFRVTLGDGATIVTPPRALLLSSGEDGVGAMICGLTLDRDEAAKLLARVEKLPGERTENVERLLEKLQALAK